MAPNTPQPAHLSQQMQPWQVQAQLAVTAGLHRRAQQQPTQRSVGHQEANRHLQHQQAPRYAVLCCAVLLEAIWLRGFMQHAIT